MINTNSDFPIIPIKTLPFYRQIDSRTEWFALLPEIMNIQFKWINEQKDYLRLPENVKSYFDYAFKLWKDTVIVAGNNYTYFAVNSLRATLERIALIYSSSTDSGIDIQQMISDFESDIIGRRVQASQKIMDYAENVDSDFKLLYDILSRYFGHTSNLDLVRINQEKTNTELLNVRSNMIPLLLIIEVGNIIVNCITKLLNAQRIHPPELTGGRQPHFSYSIKKYVRLSTYVMCERHSRNKVVKIRILYKSVKDVKGEVGINELYRGGMELVRFGKKEEKPEIKEIADFAIYALGPNKDKNVKVKLIKEHSDGEVYELSWPKNLEIDGSLLGMVAAQNEAQDIPLFDFINEFIGIVLRE